MSFTHNGKVRLHWEEKGSGSPVLLIMGHAFSSDMWYPIIPELSKTHRVIWFDNRGTGTSDSTKDATVSDLAADARAVLDAAGVDSAHVFGVSMGGGVAMQLAYETPDRVRSLLLGCTAMRTESHTPKASRGKIAYYVPLRFLRKVFRAGYGSACSDEAAERDLDVLVRMKVSPRGILAQVKAMESYDLTPDKVATLDLPTLVMHGTEDGTVSPIEGEKIFETIPGSRLITYAGAGHNYLVSYPEKANADVLAFVDEVDAKEAEPATAEVS